MSDEFDRMLGDLRTRLAEASDLQNANEVLAWDQTTYMPPGGVPARGRQMAVLARLAHETFTDPAIGRLLDKLAPQAEALPYDDDNANLIRVTRREYMRATQVPADFMAEATAHGAETYDAWTRARPANDFATMIPLLEKTLELSRRYADFFPGYDHIADPLIDRSDGGMTVAEIRPIFAALRQALTPMVEAICAREPVDDSFLHRHYPTQAQWDFGLDVIRQFGYDFNRGRQDQSAHPFTTSFSIGDVRITTRIDEENLAEALFGTLHECGHALYEQGVNPAFEATPLAGGTSSGVHESQSRLWENIVGRGRRFWRRYYGPLQAAFPEQLGDVDEEDFYRAVNKVQRSLIRTDADEVTYNLHVIIRFELELDLLEGKLAVADLAEAWRARYAEYLGVSSPDDRDGVLQDVHWYGDFIGGGFQGYALGNIMASQFYARALEDHPDIPDQIEAGEFDTLHTWLREHIYRHGSKFTAGELLERVVGGPMKLEPYLAYLQEKFGPFSHIDQ